MKTQKQRKTKRVKRKIKTKRNKNNLKQQKKIVLTMLRELKWPQTQRHNVLRKDQKGYEGFVLGLVTSWAGKDENAGYRQMLSLKTRDKKYKKLFRESKKLMKMKDPTFKFTSIQFNKNHRAARHLDAKNMGISYIVGMGDYKGGELIIFDENEKNPVRHNIRNKFYTFNGSKYPHETAPFKGERYTIVFYSI